MNFQTTYISKISSIYCQNRATESTTLKKKVFMNPKEFECNQAQNYNEINIFRVINELNLRLKRKRVPER